MEWTAGGRKMNAFNTDRSSLYNSPPHTIPWKKIKIGAKMGKKDENKQ